MDPYVIIQYKGQERESSVARGYLSSFPYYYSLQFEPIDLDN